MHFLPYGVFLKAPPDSVHRNDAVVNVYDNRIYHYNPKLWIQCRGILSPFHQNRIREECDIINLGIRNERIDSEILNHIKLILSNIGISPTVLASDSMNEQDLYSIINDAITALHQAETEIFRGDWHTAELSAQTARYLSDDIEKECKSKIEFK